jgi:hypothetical protein
VIPYILQEEDETMKVGEVVPVPKYVPPPSSDPPASTAAAPVAPSDGTSATAAATAAPASAPAGATSDNSNSNASEMKVDEEAPSAQAAATDASGSASAGERPTSPEPTKPADTATPAPATTAGTGGEAQAATTTTTTTTATGANVTPEESTEVAPPRERTPFEKLKEIALKKHASLVMAMRRLASVVKRSARLSPLEVLLVSFDRLWRIYTQDVDGEGVGVAESESGVSEDESTADECGVNCEAIAAIVKRVDDPTRRKKVVAEVKRVVAKIITDYRSDSHLDAMRSCDKPLARKLKADFAFALATAGKKDKGENNLSVDEVIKSYFFLFLIFLLFISWRESPNT